MYHSKTLFFLAKGTDFFSLFLYLPTINPLIAGEYMAKGAIYNKPTVYTPKEKLLRMNISSVCFIKTFRSAWLYPVKSLGHMRCKEKKKNRSTLVR